MAFKLAHPLQGVQLEFHSGGKILYPLHDRNAFRIGTSLKDFFTSYGEQLQREWLEKGQLEALLQEPVLQDMETGRLSVHFPAARDRFSHPAFTLHFDYWRMERTDLCWGFIPVLGIEETATSCNKLEEYLETAVQSEFSRNQRLQALQSVISTIWFRSAELKAHDFSFSFPTPSELTNPNRSSTRSLLSRVATRLKIVNPQAYGMEDELTKLVRALKNPYTTNLLLVGPSGVGKTVLVRELVYQKAEHGIQRDFWETTASRLIKELTGERGWQDNIMHLVKELRESDAVLYIRNLRELFEVGQYVGNEISVADFLLPFLARGEITLLGEATEAEKGQIELRNPSYLSPFHLIQLVQPSGKRLEKIILERVSTTAEQHQVKVTREAIREVVRLNQRFSPYAGFPGKPIRFLENLIVETRSSSTGKQLGKSEIIRHFCEASGLPVFMVDPTVPMQIDKTEGFFTSRLFGQSMAVSSLVDVLASVKTAMTRTGKPIASFLFVGPTGVGKTEFAKVLAHYMFGSRDRIERFDMSEYASAYAVSQLIGLVSGQDGLLTAALRRQPFSVVLFDEIEKAHPSFYDLLLQVLSEGRLSDQRGQLANFCSSIIIMTSNIGASNLQENRIGWTREVDQQTVNDHFLSAVQSFFRPELVNRIDKIIPFTPLNQADVKRVLNREIELLRKREGIQNRKLHLEIDDEVIQYLAREGYDPVYGARYLQRTLREAFIIPLARALNVQDRDDQLAVRAQLKGDKVEFVVEADPLSLELFLEELEKANLAEQASNQRRSLRTIMQGPFYVRLLSELDILKRQARNKNKFWKDGGTRERQLQAYLGLVNRTKELQASIDQVEQQLTLAVMGVEPFLTKYESGLQDWIQQFKYHQLDLLQETAREFNQCVLAIYGSQPQKVFRFYQKILEMQDLEWKATTIWFRDSYFQKMNAIKEEDKPRHSTDPVEKGYVTANFPPGEINFSPIKPGDQLYGISLKVTGPAAFLFLRREMGMHEWGWSPKDKQLYVIEVDQERRPVPGLIHRREFYRSASPRRVYDGQVLKDTVYGWRFNVSEAQLAQECFDRLSELFYQNVKASLQ